MIKKYYLYNFTCTESELDSSEGITLITHTNFIAVDINIYNTKEKRIELSKKLRLLPFWVSQSIFLKLLENLNEYNFVLNYISFYIEIEEEFQEKIETLADNRDYRQLKFLIEEIKNYFDTNIKSLSFDYRNKFIEMTNSGSISIDSSIKDVFFQEIFKNFLYDI